MIALHPQGDNVKKNTFFLKVSYLISVLATENSKHSFKPTVRTAKIRGQSPIRQRPLNQTLKVPNVGQLPIRHWKF